MEVIGNGTTSIADARILSSFECEDSAIDSVLGVHSQGDRKLRMESPAHASFPAPKLRLTTPQVYAPIEVVPKCSARSKGQVTLPVPAVESDGELRRERLIRLLDRQQAWYDAEIQAALAADRLLSLCEHHQQQWLPTNQQQPASQQPASPPKDRP